MLLNGQKIEGPNEEIIVIPRPGEPIVFTARAVLDMSEFDSLCPRPKPSIKRMKSGEKIEETDDPRYIAKMDIIASQRFAYLILKSLEATEGLEWESIEMDDPSTWSNYEPELRASGFSDIEIQRIVVGVMSANCLNEAKLEQARKLFLAGRAEQRDSLSLPAEANSTPHGEAVNV